MFSNVYALWPFICRLPAVSTTNLSRLCCGFGGFGDWSVRNSPGVTIGAIGLAREAYKTPPVFPTNPKSSQIVRFVPLLIHPAHKPAHEPTSSLRACLQTPFSKVVREIARILFLPVLPILAILPVNSAAVNKKLGIIFANFCLTYQVSHL